MDLLGPARQARTGLAHPALRGAMQLRNAAAAMCALDALRERLPVGMQDVRRGLAEVTLPGALPGAARAGRRSILDVAHNAAGGAQRSPKTSPSSGFAPETIAVCGMLRDKDIAGVLQRARAAHHALASRLAARAARRDAPTQLCALRRRREMLRLAGEQRFAAALERAGENDKIVVFGSFLTVGEAMAWLKNNKTSKR